MNPETKPWKPWYLVALVVWMVGCSSDSVPCTTSKIEAPTVQTKPQFDILMLAFDSKGEVIQERGETGPDLSDWHKHFTKDKVPGAAYTQAFVKDKGQWKAVRFDDGNNLALYFDMGSDESDRRGNQNN